MRPPTISVYQIDPKSAHPGHHVPEIEHMSKKCPKMLDLSINFKIGTINRKRAMRDQDRDITSRQTTPSYITSHHNTTHHITSHHITSHHITSDHITAHRRGGPAELQGTSEKVQNTTRRALENQNLYTNQSIGGGTPDSSPLVTHMLYVTWQIMG